MKKIYYLLAFSVLALSACQKEPALHSYLPTERKDLTITLQASDYAHVTGYPSSTKTIDDDADAQKYIPMILNAEYSTIDDGSTAAVTYQKSALYFKPAADSLYSDVYYSLTSADYLLLPNNKYTDFSLSQALAWLPYKYTSPVNNQLVLLNFTPYPATLTPPYSYLYYNGAWKMIYTITPAEYAVVGLGKYNQFTSSNDATLTQTLGALVKTDINVQDTVKKGDIVFVSFNYYGSDKNTYQRVQPLEYDGNNYVAPQQSTGTVNFIKKGGTWTFVQPLPVVNYTLTSADDATIAASNFGTASLRSNLSSYGDFETSWAKADLQGAFILCLTKDITSPVTNTIYRVHYPLYSGGSDVDSTLDFMWNGTAWVAQ